MQQTSFPATLAALLSFGVAYNALVERLERDGHERGFLSILVTGGVAVTVAAMAPVIGERATLRLLAAFAASGSPMIVGSILRYTRKRREDEFAARAAARSALRRDGRA